MRFYTAGGIEHASIQSTGLWLQIGGRVFGVAPNWWWNHNHPKHNARMRVLDCLGLKIAAPYGDHSREMFVLYVGPHRLGWFDRHVRWF